eukprot:scaffold507113_cov83-Attheya_sp.AAC.4
MSEELQQMTLSANNTGRSTSLVEHEFVGEPVMFGEQAEREGCEEILAALTPSEKEKLADPNMPLRHFRAEKGKTDKAIKKIKATIAWRDEFGVEKIKGGDEEMRKTIMKESETGKMYVRGYDEEGRAIIYMRPAKENTNVELDNMRDLVYHLERAIASTLRKSGKEKFNMIIDYDGFKLRNAPPLSTSKLTLNILQNHYPERLHRAYMCNPPLVFRTFWALIQPFVDPVTKEKIVFCHGKSGVEKMKERMDMDTIEVSVGGTGTNLREFDVQEYFDTPLNVTFDDPDIGSSK